VEQQGPEKGLIFGGTQTGRTTFSNVVIIEGLLLLSMKTNDDIWRNGGVLRKLPFLIPTHLLVPLLTHMFKIHVFVTNTLYNTSNWDVTQRGDIYEYFL
jgi:hypothetical protein